MRDSRIDGGFEAGISVRGATVTLAHSLVLGVQPRQNDGGLGDGIIVQGGQEAALVTLSGNRIEQAARAAVSSFGGVAAMAGNALECDPIDLDAELYLVKASYQDLGGNTCGCGDARRSCQQLTANVMPPAPIGK
jgi:hypothetical protein